MSLAELKKPKPNRVIGIDASTNSIAFCVFEDGRPVSWGEIAFEGATVYERLVSARKVMYSVSGVGILDADFVAIEAGIVVKSVQTGIKMAYVFGVIMSILLENGAQVVEVAPVSWQSYIGNKNFTKAQKDEVAQEFPGKTKTWYSNKIRSIRKEKTLKWAADLGVKTTSDNVADATGIAYFAYKNVIDKQ